jgi:hypothetical protein
MTQTQKQILPRFLHITIYYLLVTVIILGFLEIFVRFTYPSIGPMDTSRDLTVDSVYGSSAGLRPMASGFSGSKMFSVDALGFWKYTVQSDSLQDGWLLLGDSATMGIGVEPDSSFAGRLSAAFRKWHIFNPSWLGYSSADYVNVAKVLFHRQLQSKLWTPKIRRLTIFWTLNDIYSHCDVGMPPGQVVRNYGSQSFAWLRQHFRTYAWFRHLFFDRPKTYFQFDDQFYQQDDPRFVAALKDLKILKKLCSNANVQLEVVILPYEYQLRRANLNANRPQAILTQELDKLHILSYDIASTFRDIAEDSQDFYLFGDGIHFSNRGHAVISHYVQETIHPQSK